MLIRYRRLCCAMLMAVLSLPIAAQAAEITLLDRIIAVVNDDVITRHDFDERLKLVQRQLNSQGIPLPAREVLEKQLLERMIVDRVQLQYARETGMRVDDAQLEKALARIAQDSNMSLQQFRDALAEEGVDFAKFREDVRAEILIARLREREIANTVTVSDADVDNYLKNQAAQKDGKSEEYSLAHVMLLVPEMASQEQIAARRQRAEQALEQIRKGADFGQVAASFSDAADALEGGVLGWRAAGRLPTLFQEALKTMKPGEVSGILKSANGFHILKLLDKRGQDGRIVVQQTHARHILIKTGEIVSEGEARNRLLQLKERLDNGAKFAELARLYSEDGSAANGGDLGWLSPGETVPEFERAMEALRPGQTSIPVQTEFGWHLIQVIERRNQDVTEERQRLLAHQAIRALKADEAYQDWVRQLRDRAYVEYRLEDK
ncbi:MAG: peptidylprolyl isomerase [Pseudomonadota bacterium]